MYSRASVIEYVRDEETQPTTTNGKKDSTVEFHVVEVNYNDGGDDQIGRTNMTLMCLAL